MEGFTAERLEQAFAAFRDRLLSLARKRLNPILLRRFAYEDILQETYAAAVKRLSFFNADPEVPLYFKLRTILLQTIADVERRHLKAEGRDVYKEVDADGPADGENADLQGLDVVAADVTSPASRGDRDERHALLRNAIAALPENDRQIILLRHFDGMGNAEAAAALGIEPKAASIRHVRALERLQKKLMELSCFRTK